MTNFSLTPPLPVSAKQENQTKDNGTLNSCSIGYYTDIEWLVYILNCVACIFGLPGNGAVIWLLGFHMKRNPFTTYILNLAVADFGVLTLGILSAIRVFLVTNCRSLMLISVVRLLLFHLMFSISQFLLTLISMDRCVAVLFPIWYRCHRPEKLSTILCGSVWIFCFLIHGICCTLIVFKVFHGFTILFFVFLVNAVVSLPLITISALILFIRFCFKSQQHRRRKLLKAILLTLFFYLFLACPLNVMYIMFFHPLSPYDRNSPTNINLFYVGYLCASVNSFVNPLIYFLVGRKKKGLCAENLRLILQRVFKQEEEVYGEELQLSVQTQLPA
ncbi:mas-related G-protein coupled receptor member D-like [Tiliqua scincoides]|uniref:mas-related G-protein coupled receptor member D-like n=1 Tax=Tiliqua scincoides TaxID=71010 RepID=UPI0034628E4D